MEFKLSLNWGKKKSTLENTFNNNTPPELWGNSIFYPLNTTSQNDNALIQMVNELPEVGAPVNYILDILSTIPYAHYTTKGKEIIKVEDSRVMETLEHPNQYHTENDFIKLFFLNRIVLGAGYVNFMRSIGFENVGQLYVLPTEHTEPILESQDKDYRLNNIKGYETSFGGQIIELDKADVFVQKEATIGAKNYINTRSRLMAAILTSDSLRNNYEARIKMLKDRGSVGIISPRDINSTITPDDADKMREKYYQENGITGNRYPFTISPRSLDFTSTSMNSGELELLPNKLADFQIVCNVLGLDPALFGLGNNTYNNKKLAKTSLYEDTIIPYFDNYLQFMGNVFGLPKSDFLKADYSQIAAMQEDYDKTVNANSKAYNDDIITEKEYRESIGYEGGEDKKKRDFESNPGTQGTD